VKIYAGSDHAGVALKARLAAHLRASGHQVIDLGTNDEAATDYPDWAARVAYAVRDDVAARGLPTRGLIVCGSGVGVTIVANKVPHIRAVDAWSVEVARVSRAHNDTNVLCLGARLLEEDEARAITGVWLETPFEGGRHARRAAKIGAIEAHQGAALSVDREIELLARDRVIERIWSRDPTVFTPDAEIREPVRKSILGRLGWLRAPEEMAAAVADLTQFAAEVRARGFRQALLMGMGGSSLCPEVLAQTFDARGGIPVRVLDSTDPAAVAEALHALDFDRTLFVVASKSGGTIEVAALESLFWQRALARRGFAEARSQFCAITDASTELHHRARHRYHRVFVNPSDIGGRYSALSLFGLVPAALLGLDLGRLLAVAGETAAACRQADGAENPGAQLGAFLGAQSKQGRDKLTLVLPPEIAALGGWIEQLVAESTGKNGRGIVPIDLEPLGPPAVYGDDRAFVVVDLAEAALPTDRRAIDELRLAGHPILELTLADRYALGAEFFRWEFATAVAGASLAVNPFDEPNVTEAKAATSRALETYWREGALPGPGATWSVENCQAVVDHLGSAGPGDYLAFCAFFQRSPARDRLLTELRRRCRDRWRVATTVGYGPRFLHSTGQLHKGGSNRGVFLQLTGDRDEDIEVPERGFSFGVLLDAQALGDLEALRQHHRRVGRLHLGAHIEAGLEQIVNSIPPVGANIPADLQPSQARKGLPS
jgi:RpiB/LacA/LacB family sugar-phosphate isomerase